MSYYMYTFYCFLLNLMIIIRNTNKTNRNNIIMNMYEYKNLFYIRNVFYIVMYVINKSD